HDRHRWPIVRKANIIFQLSERLLKLGGPDVPRFAPTTEKTKEISRMFFGAHASGISFDSNPYHNSFVAGLRAEVDELHTCLEKDVCLAFTHMEFLQSRKNPDLKNFTKKVSKWLTNINLAVVSGGFTISALATILTHDQLVGCLGIGVTAIALIAIRTIFGPYYGPDSEFVAKLYEKRNEAPKILQQIQKEIGSFLGYITNFVHELDQEKAKPK
ncbi:hypothetical protein KJ780_02035, partial [Candidatus Micrarchaeota archaeon]|nr:hypothetical protein [Candidatus Micrarchaeota archaeon]